MPEIFTSNINFSDTLQLLGGGLYGEKKLTGYENPGQSIVYSDDDGKKIIDGSINKISIGLFSKYNIGLGQTTLELPTKLITHAPQNVRAGEAFTIATALESITDPSISTSGPGINLAMELRAAVDANINIDYGNFFQQAEFKGGASATLFDTSEWLDFKVPLFEDSKLLKPLEGILTFISNLNPANLNSENTIHGTFDSFRTIETTGFNYQKPLLGISIDIDDAIGIFYPPMKGLDLSTSDLPNGDILKKLNIEANFGAASINLILGVSPYITTRFTPTSLTNTITTSYGQTITGDLNQELAFSLPTHFSESSFNYTSNYKIEGNFEVELGLQLTGGISTKLGFFEFELSDKWLPGFSADFAVLEANYGIESPRWKLWEHSEQISISHTEETQHTVSVDPNRPTDIINFIPTTSNHATIRAYIRSIEEEFGRLGPTYKIIEGTEQYESKTYSIIIERSGNVNTSSTINYSIEKSKDLSENDVSLPATTSGQISFLPGESTKALYFEIIADTQTEANESFTFIFDSDNTYIDTPKINVEIVSDDGLIIDARDQTIGTPDNDIIFDSTENDTIFAGGGNDTIYSKNGYDNIHGDSGSDIFYTSNGFIHGGSGRDTLKIENIKESSRGHATYWGVYRDGSELGNLNYEASRSFIEYLLKDGNEFEIWQLGIQDNGNSTHDTQIRFTGIENWEILNGSNQNDIVIANKGTGRIYNGGGGFDALYLDLTVYEGSTYWNNTQGVAHQIAGAFEISNFERIILNSGKGDTTFINNNGSYDDIITQDGDDNIQIVDGNVNAGDGNNSIHLSHNTIGSFITTGQGNDEIVVQGNGQNNIQAGGGDDVITSQRGIVNGGNGNDTLTLSRLDSNQFEMTVWRFNPNIGGSPQIDYNTDFFTILNSINTQSSFTIDYYKPYAYITNQITINGVENINYLEGGDGSDLLIKIGDGKYFNGGSGIDTFFGDFSASDAPIILINNGAEATFSNATLKGIERLTIGLSNLDDTVESETDFSDEIYGNGGNDRLYGGGGNDSLFGGDGNDQIMGGGGIDNLKGQQGSDTYLYYYGDGTDTITDEASTANEFNTLSLNDIYIQDAFLSRSNKDLIVSIRPSIARNASFSETITIINQFNETARAGVDTIKFKDSVALTRDEIIQSLNLYNPTTGTSLDDYLTGTSGVDQLVGYAGNDTYIFNTSGDTAIEQPDDGFDTINASLTVTLPIHVEILNLVGTTDLAGSGNELANQINGNSGSNWLSGEAGNDTIHGGSGNDDIRGGTGGDLLYGDDGDDVLDGGDGADLMNGGAGNDRYTVSEAGDVIEEEADGGIDTVVANGDYVLYANLENLELLAGAINGSGNTGSNWIIGNAENNWIGGGAGGDAIFGRDGNDALYGDDGDDYLYGEAGDDILDGGAGTNQLIGGSGNDRYIIRNLGDTIEEDADAGTDTAEVYVDNYVPFANVENVILAPGILSASGSTADNWMEGNSGNNFLGGGLGHDALFGFAGNDYLKGDDGDDRLEGGDGDDTLEGNFGVDTMVGGNGNDIYYVDGPGDNIVETPTGGIDTVYSTGFYTLSGNLENLVIIGEQAVDGTGDAGSNWMRGNDNANVLSGVAGDDTIFGGGGADSLIGGQGSDTLMGQTGGDTYGYSLGDGNDSIFEDDSDATSYDLLRLIGIARNQIGFGRFEDDLIISVSDLNNPGIVTVTDWFAGTKHQLEGIMDADGLRATSLISEIANLGTAPISQTSLLQPEAFSFSLSVRS